MRRMEEEEEAAILEYGNYNSCYYVQSPCSVSHANSIIADHHSNKQQHYDEEPSPAVVVAAAASQHNSLSRCSSSRASFIHDHTTNHNIITTVLPASTHHHHHHHHHHRHHAQIALMNSCCKKTNNNNISILVPALQKLGKVADNNKQQDCYDYDEQAHSCSQYLSFTTYTSPVWIALQFLWRFLLSFMLALLVFYLVTKPSPPHLSLKVTGVNQFELPEGLDLTGVATNFLSCNISMGLIIDNKSKVFGLHLLPPVVNIYFGRVPLVLSQGGELYVKSREWREMEVYAGTKKKAMYGAGRNMEDMLNSGKGLPLTITLAFSSYVPVVPNLIHSDFHHRAHCLLFLQNLYDKKHHTQAYNSTCVVTS